MKVPIDIEMVREEFLQKLFDLKINGLTISEREDVSSRGDLMLDLIRIPASDTL